MTNTTDDANFLCVNGIPAYVAEPIPEVIPGTISYFTLNDFKNSASSPPRPKIIGSPPFSLTTILFNFAYFIINSFVSS